MIAAIELVGGRWDGQPLGINCVGGLPLARFRHHATGEVYARASYDTETETWRYLVQPALVTR